MKLNKDSIKAFLKLIKNVEYQPVETSNALVFFPLEASIEKDIDGIELVSKGKATSNFKKLLTPGIVLKYNADGKMIAELGYSDLSFSPEFDFIQYTELIGCKLSQKNIDSIQNLECFIVEKNYIKATFKLSV